MSLGRRLKNRLPEPMWSLALKGHTAIRYLRHAARDSGLRLLAALRLQQGSFGRSPDLVHPQLFTDKLRWRMLYDRRPLLQMCSDRLAARDYVAARAGQQYLVPLLGVFDHPEEIPWAELPPPYVVKATHGQGWNLFVRHAGEVDPGRFQQVLARWLQTNFYHVSWEWSYKHVPRHIIIERFIGLDGKVPDDYKVHCFDGEPRAIGVCHDRFTPAYRWTWHDPCWNSLAFVSAFRRPVESPAPAPPRRLAELLELSRALSRDFDYIRVDLYCVGDRVYFGELTPTQAAGNRPYSDAGEAWMGALWRLPGRAQVKSVGRGDAVVSWRGRGSGPLRDPAASGADTASDRRRADP